MIQPISNDNKLILKNDAKIEIVGMLQKKKR